MRPLGTQEPDPLNDAVVDSGLFDGIPGWRAYSPRIQTVRRGDYLCREGDRASELWIVVSGTLTVEHGGVAIEQRHRGVVVGEQAYPPVCDSAPRRTASLVAGATDVEVLVFPYSKLDEIPLEKPFFRNMARLLSFKLKGASAVRSNLFRRISDRQAAMDRAGASPGHDHQRLHGDAFVENERLFWFSDVRNFSSSVEDLAKDRVGLFCQAFLQPQTEAIEAAEGGVDKFMGDAVMGDWALDTHRVQRIEGAVDAALRISDVLRDTSFEGKPMRLRIGLHMGKALRGHCGTSHRSQFTSVGSTVNKAARLESVHSPVELDGCDVRLSDEVFAELRSPLKERFERFDNVELKNMGDHHTVYGARVPKEKS